VSLKGKSKLLKVRRKSKYGNKSKFTSRRVSKEDRDHFVPETEILLNKHVHKSAGNETMAQVPSNFKTKRSYLVKRKMEEGSQNSSISTSNFAIFKDVHLKSKYSNTGSLNNSLLRHLN
jgi:hypothetical protein